MYLKIHYRGRLRHVAEVNLLADEIEYICQSNGWKCADFQVMEETGNWIHSDPALLEKYLDQIAAENKQLDEELSAIKADESTDPEKKREIMYDLLRQFGERNRLYKSDEN